MMDCTTSFGREYNGDISFEIKFTEELLTI
jgi:hypothetical protein